MKVIKAGYEVLDRSKMGSLQRIEMAGRLAYKSEGRITEDSAFPFVEMIVKHGHNPVIEMANMHVALEFNMPMVEFNALMQDFIQDGSHLKYIALAFNVENDNSSIMLISGTIRAFSEMVIGQLPISSKESIIQTLAHTLETKCGESFPFAIKGNDGDHLPFVPNPNVVSGVVSSQHMQELLSSVPEILENHMMVAVKFICNRAVSHELVRHRPLSILQESQRYCRYSDDRFGNEVTFIKPKAFFECPGDLPNEPGFDDRYQDYHLWEKACADAEKTYLALLENNSPQAARTVLPNSCKTELIMFATIAEWRHILAMRTAPNAEPSMLELMIPLSDEFFSEENRAKWE